ncbi:NAD-dependent epimerase/dehydratase family protein [Nocardia sp. NPDC050718]|uniref:NAD-dependent epimerase/dehydratase family protein n=1 Tax=Nocardia sp. NPDC050718 TaxID=3155788 RepID=UPI0033C5DE1A
MAIVLVTGATGFVAGHCVRELLEHGYQVRATVRDLDAVGRRTHLVELADRLGGAVEFVQADLTADDGWDVAVKDCDYVLHVASPIPGGGEESEQAMVEAAVEGTLRVLRAAAVNPTVRRVVLTSSIVTVNLGHDVDKVCTEQDFSNPDRLTGYDKSKALAERAAREFVDGAPSLGFDLVTLHPPMILGPLLHPQTNISHEPVIRLLGRTVPGSLDVGWSTVDVRDLARAHRLALETPEAGGQRYICGGEHVWMREMAGILAAEFGPRGFTVPSRTLPHWLVKLAALTDDTVKRVVPALGTRERVSAEKARAELGLTFLPVAQSVLDTAESLLTHGIVTAPAPRRWTRRRRTA